MSSAGSGVNPRSKLVNIDELLAKHRLTSQDDEEKKFEFKSLDRVMTEM